MNTKPILRGEELCCDFSHLSLLTETGKISKNNTINITYILEKQIRMEHDIIRTDNPVILQTSALSFWVGNVAAQGSYHPLILQRPQIPKWQHRMWRTHSRTSPKSMSACGGSFSGVDIITSRISPRLPINAPPVNVSSLSWYQGAQRSTTRIIRKGHTSWPLALLLNN